MEHPHKIFRPGDRVLAWDSLLYKDDWTTPDCMMPATVTCWYGQVVRKYSDDLVLGPYETLVDVVFDHRKEKVSHGHFGWGVETAQSLFTPEAERQYKQAHLRLFREKAEAL